MIDVAVSEGGLEAVDDAKNKEVVRTDGWHPVQTGPPLDRRVDERIAGRTRRLAFRDAAVSIESSVTRSRWISRSRP